MSCTCFRAFRVVVCCLAANLLFGCADGETPLNNADSLSADQLDLNNRGSGVDGNGLPTAAISSAASWDSAPQSTPANGDGTAESIVQEIKTLRKEPVKNAKNADEVDAARRERNRKIVDLATLAISRSHQDPEKEQTFTDAVALLMEARMDLALDGDRREIDLLYDDAESVYERAPNSSAAAEAAYVLARFAHTNARRFAKEEPRWLEEFSRQARLFATNFPHETDRAVALLYSAGWSCELHSLPEEAASCYTLIQQQFPLSPQASQVTAVLRRLNLKGTSLQLAGPTSKGSYISIDDYRGKVVLIVFWAKGTNRFRQHLPAIASAAQKYSSSGFSIIGVNLDKEEKSLQSFVEQNSLTWPQIFFSHPEKRQWNNPIVKYYGIRDVPMFWLVDANGVVVDTHAHPANLDTQIDELLSSNR